MKNFVPNSKLTGAGIGGVIAMIMMAIVNQIDPQVVDFSQEVMGVPLNEMIIFAAMWVVGYFKTERRPT